MQAPPSSAASAPISQFTASRFATGQLTPGQQCRAAIASAGQLAATPSQLMEAIGRVESGRSDRAGHVDPWPWSINAEGVDHVFDTKAQVIAAVRGLQAQGIRSIDVGCMQVNLYYHPDAFASLEDAFDPARNAAYAAKLLNELKLQTGSWATATAWYHSATPELGEDYRRKVMAALSEEQRSPLSAARPVVLPIMQASTTTGPFMLTNHRSAALVLKLPAGAAGRGLAAYRTRPVTITSWFARR